MCSRKEILNLCSVYLGILYNNTLCYCRPLPPFIFIIFIEIVVDCRSFTNETRSILSDLVEGKLH